MTNQCGNLTYVAPVLAGDNVTVTFVPFNINRRLSVTWKTATATSSTGFFSISRDWKYQPANFNLLVKTNEGDQGRIIYAQYGNCKTKQIHLRLHCKIVSSCILKYYVSDLYKVSLIVWQIINSVFFIIIHGDSSQLKEPLTFTCASLE